MIRGFRDEPVVGYFRLACFFSYPQALRLSYWVHTQELGDCD